MRVISARMDYWPPGRDAVAVLRDPLLGYVSRYALGRDYHKLLRKRLAQLVARVTGAVGEFGARVYVDSAPVLEKALAEQAGLGVITSYSIHYTKLYETRAREGRLQALVGDALVGRMHVHQNQPLGVLGQDVDAVRNNFV